MKRTPLTVVILAASLLVGFGWGVLTERRYDRGHAYVEAEEAIASRYVSPVDRNELMRGCYEGMIGSLGDVYSRYYTTDELAEDQARQESTKIEDLVQIQQIDEGGRTYALIWLGSFTSVVQKQFPEQAAEALSMSPDAVILDLRGNLGGIVTAAEVVSGVWIGNKVMARMDNHHGNVELRYGAGESILGHLPVAVLVNQNTASAAEIVAGALRDQMNAPLIGTQTYGKGLVQGYVPMPNGGWAKITTHWWHTPKDVSVSPGGLTPDFVVHAERCQTCTNLDAAVTEAIYLLSR